jgi:hypothetical protein
MAGSYSSLHTLAPSVRSAMIGIFVCRHRTRTIRSRPHFFGGRAKWQLALAGE